MQFLRNLQVKVLLSALIPGSTILIVVALIALSAYTATVLEVVGQRDAELARLTADRLSDGLQRYTRILETAATNAQTGRLDDLASELHTFDGGVAVYDQHGTLTWTTQDPSPVEMGKFPVPVEFQNVKQSGDSSYSDVFVHPDSGTEYVMVTFPIVDESGAFQGAVTGLSSLRGSLMSSMLSEWLDVAPGEQGLAYLVDGSGRSIFHGRPDLVAANLTGYPPVAEVSGGFSGANLSEAPTGERVISGFAPVPGTNWGVVTQQLWSDVEGPIRDSSLLVLGLLVLGAIIASGGIWYFIGRALKPIRELNAGAQRIAGGEYDHRIQANSGDEVEELANQFNVMAEAIAASHSELTDRVELRAQELAESEARMRAVITGAPVMIFALDTEGRITLAEGRPHEAAGFDYSAWVGSSIFERVGDLPDVLAQFRRALHGQELATTVNWNEMTFEVRSSPMRGDSGNIEGVIVVATDITEQRAQANALAKSEESAKAAAEENAVMAEIGRIIGSSLDISLVYDLFAEQTRRLIGFDAIAILGVLPDRQTLRVAYMSGTYIHARRPGVEFPLTGTATEEAYRSRKLVSFQPGSKDELISQYPGLIGGWEQGLRSFIAVPLLSHNEVIGILWFAAKSSGAYQARDREIAERVASQIAGAVANSQLYEEIREFYAQEQRHAEQFRTIGELGRHFTSILDPSELLSNIGELGAKSLGYEMTAIGIVEADELVFRPEANPNMDSPVRRSLVDGDRNQGITGLVASTGRPVIVPDVKREPRYIPLGNARSSVTVPISAGGHALGVLHSASSHANAFDDADQVVLQALAQEVGIAIENARLFEVERRRNERMAAINAVALNVSSVLTLGELLPHVAELVKETFGYHTVSVFLIDEESEEVVLQAVDSSDRELPVRGTRMKVNTEGIVGHVAGTGLPWIANDVTKDPYYTTLSVKAPETRSELAMPIKQGDLVVGVLDFHAAVPNAFGESDMLVAQTLANQLAVAIENARIFDEARDLAILEERNRMAREIHDTLAQGFTGIVIQLEAGEQAMERDPVEIGIHVAQAKKLARECLAEARRSVWNLLPEALEENPLDVIVASEVERFNETVDSSASFRLLGARRQLPAVVQAAMMRICQESLTNIRKYAEASTVNVTLDFALDAVALTVEDDGVGFDPERVRIEEGRGGFGLTGMRQRARLLRGDVEIDSAPSQGTRVAARIPTG